MKSIRQNLWLQPPQTTSHLKIILYNMRDGKQALQLKAFYCYIKSLSKMLIIWYCGMQHFAASNVCRSKLFTWGDNGAGQLVDAPQVVQILSLECPSLVAFSRASDKFHDEMQVYALNCGELYTMCLYVAINGRTHIYSFAA